MRQVRDACVRPCSLFLSLPLPLPSPIPARSRPVIVSPRPSPSPVIVSLPRSLARSLTHSLIRPPLYRDFPLFSPDGSPPVSLAPIALGPLVLSVAPTWLPLALSRSNRLYFSSDISSSPFSTLFVAFSFLSSLFFGLYSPCLDPRSRPLSVVAHVSVSSLLPSQLSAAATFQRYVGLMIKSFFPSLSRCRPTGGF